MTRRTKKGSKNNGRKFSKNYQPKKRGRPKQDPILKDLKEVTSDSFKLVVCKYLYQPIGTLEQLFKSQDIPAMDKCVISILLRCIRSGDQFKLEFLLQRTIGKVKDQIDIHKFEQKINGLDPAELKLKAKEAIEFLERKG